MLRSHPSNLTYRSDPLPLLSARSHFLIIFIDFEMLIKNCRRNYNLNVTEMSGWFDIHNNYAEWKVKASLQWFAMPFYLVV